MTKIVWSMIFLVALFGLAVWMVFYWGQAGAQNDTQLFVRGSIYINAQNKVNNLLITNGVVAGWNVDPAQYPQAAVVDLQGAALYPGFHDSHVQLLEAGYGFSSNCVLYGVTDSDGIAKTVGKIASKLPGKEPLFGGAFSMVDYDAWSLEDLAKLDAATGDRPIIIVDRLGHNAIVNSAAMKMCQITCQTQCPVGGTIIYQKGQPTGMLRESAVNLAGDVLFPKFDQKQIRRVAKVFFDQWASFGYTSINDLSGFAGGRIVLPEMLKEMEKEGQLPLRINYLYTFFTLDEIDKALKYVGKDTERVRFLGLKLFVDGAYGGGQAWTSWLNAQKNHGVNYVYTDDSKGKNYNINRIIEKADDLKMNVHYNAQGDRAIEAVLNALDKVIAQKGKLSSVHTMAHMAFPTDRQIARIKKFGDRVFVSIPLGCWLGELEAVHYYGDRVRDAFPISKILAAGISMGISSDFGVCPIEASAPTSIMNIAVTGAGNLFQHKPVGINDILDSLTIGGARTSARNDTGKLEMGHSADMVVYEKDLYAVPPNEMTKDYPRVLATYIGGNKTYELRE